MDRFGLMGQDNPNVGFINWESGRSAPRRTHICSFVRHFLTGRDADRLGLV